MSGRRLPRDLRHTINRLAHERAQVSRVENSYKRRYAEEKARLQAVVVTWLAAGKTPAEALAKLECGCESANSRMRHAIRELQRRIRETQ